MPTQTNTNNKRTVFSNAGIQDMWLINTHSYALEDITDPSLVKYAILSHTWEDEEVTFHDIRHLTQLKTPRFSKVWKTCEIARERGLQYAWIDTCCIDKSSSAELSEAINSMFTWYHQSAVCFVFLSDLPALEDMGPALRSKSGFPYPSEMFRRCRWFTRGWTLQELIAPDHVEFLDSKWVPFCRKANCLDILSEVTGISHSVLKSPSNLRQTPVAVKMSWAASRETKRIEDRAYSLLGIFDINMPLIYGEGHKAFRRLQEEIARETNDLSLFAWIGPSEEDQGFQVSRGVFARSPSEFGDCSKMHRYHTRTEYQPEFTLTNKGVRIDSKLYKHKTAQCVYIMYLGFTLTGTTPVCISLARTADGYVRSNPWSLDQWQPANGTNRLRDPSTIYVQKDVSPQEDLKFRSRLHRCFQVTMGLWSSMKLERVRCSPEHLWDERFATFISSNPEKSFIASMKLSVHGDDSSFGEDFPLILIFGWSKTQQRPFAVLYGDGEGVKNPKTSVKNLLPDDFPDILQNEVDWERSHDENAIENAISVVHSAPRFRAREVQFIRAVSPWGVRKTYAFVATFNLSLDTHKDPDNMVMYHISIRGRSSKLKDGNAIAKAYSFVPGTDVNVEEGT